MATVETVRTHTLVLDNDEAEMVYAAIAYLIQGGELAMIDPKGKAIHLRDTLGQALGPHRYS